MNENVTSSITRMVEEAYRLLPPPLSALPAKYTSPISLLIHSLSSGIISKELAWITYSDEELAFYLALTHDIHQKLLSNGLVSMKTAKEYLRNKLDEVGKSDYFRHIDDAVEIDACGKNRKIRGVDEKLSLICHISDVIQGNIEGIELLYWLKSKVKELDKDLTVRFYSILIPQIVGRSYIIRKIYEKYIKNKEHLALASRYGLIVIGREDDIPEVIEASWNDLRFEKGTEPVEYWKILEAERNINKNNEKNKEKHKISFSKEELKSKGWSRFARLFYNVEDLYKDEKMTEKDEPMFPVFPENIKELFVNIEFTDIKFENIVNPHKCVLCGLPHHKDESFNANMFTKIAGVDITIEKWNRFMKSKTTVKGERQWSSYAGICPLCAIEAISMREAKFAGSLNGVLSVSISKPVPISLLDYIGRILAESDKLDKPVVGEGTSERVVFDYNSATVGTQEVDEPNITNLFKKERESGMFTRIGKLISWGIYPVKFLHTFDVSIVDRPVVIPYNFRIIDFPVTDREYEDTLPWIGSLLIELGNVERSEGLKYLDFKPEHSSLALQIINKKKYFEVVEVLSSIGVRI